MSKPSGQILGNDLDDKSSSMMQCLLSMGFDSSSNCLRAIQQSGGNLDVAIDMLLNNAHAGGVCANETEDRIPEFTHYSGNTQASMGNERKSRRIVQCPISQYDIPQGKSACTCIALRAAQQFLVATRSSSGTDDPSGLISPDFLQRLLLEGVDLYKSLQSNATDTSVEHMSAEEVLNHWPSTNLPMLSTIGGVRQGILGREGLSLFSVLKECHVLSDYGEHGSSSNNWVAVVLTKTPETVVVLLPPMISSNSTGSMEKNSKHSFILIDSHPRPGISLNCYAAFHDSLEDLVNESLEQIFPVNNSLDPNDVGEMMVMMYNSFDAYPLRLKTE